MNILQLFLESMYIYFPAMVANMAPIFAHKAGVLKWLDRPIDFGIELKEVRVFGAHKTFRGFVVGVLAGGCTALLQSLFIANAPYELSSTSFAVGTALGFGALMGDVIKSFFKRRYNIASGVSWIPFDQIDFVLGATVVALLFIPISLAHIAIALVVVGCASYIVSVIGVALHIKRSL